MAAQKKQDVIVEDGSVYVLRAGTPIYVKTADICAMTGKSNQWVGQLCSQGTLNKSATPYGSMFDLSAVMSIYCNLLEKRSSPEKSEKEIKQEEAKSAADVTLKVSKATLAKLEVEELQGKMHHSDDVAAMTSDLIFNVRSAMMALPGRVAVDVAAAQTPAEAAEIVRKEVYAVMLELSNYRYDPEKYEERVRERRDWETKNGRDDDDI